MILFYTDSIGIDKPGIVAIHAPTIDIAFNILTEYINTNTKFKIFNNRLHIIPIAPFNSDLKKIELIIVDSGEK